MRLALISLACILPSCTISFQNISTHGTATDIVDEEMDARPEVSPTINVPV